MNVNAERRLDFALTEPFVSVSGTNQTHFARMFETSQMSLNVLFMGHVHANIENDILSLLLSLLFLHIPLVSGKL